MDLVPHDSRYTTRAGGADSAPLAKVARSTSHARHESSIDDSGDSRRHKDDTRRPAFLKGIPGVGSHRRREVDALDLHEVTEGRWASGELVRGRERGARQYLRRDSGEFARVHHHEDGSVARGVLLGALGGVALWAVTIALGFALFGLLGCSAASQLEGELGDLTQSLAADNADESVLSSLGGGQSCTSTEQCARGSYCAVTSRRGHMQCRVVAR